MKYVTAIVGALALISVHTAVAQRRQAQGVVVDSTTRSGLYGATVIISRIGDSTASGAISDKRGRFLVRGVSDGKNVIRVSYIGYVSFTDTISIESLGGKLDTIFLSPGSIIGAPIIVTQSRLRAMQRADTTEYDAAAFLVRPNADADKLVRQLPGVSFDNGKIRAFGEEVDKVLVDGLEFFGTDAMNTLSNLPADIIDKVQIYDSKSEAAKVTGADEQSTTKTINIVTMENKRQGMFGKGAAGYGLKDRYEGGAVYSRFDTTYRISASAMTNNINRYDMPTTDDMEQGGSESGTGGEYISFQVISSDDSYDEMTMTPERGITTTRSASITGSNLKGPLKVNASYSVSDNTTELATSLFRQFVTPSINGQIYRQDNTTTNSLTEHKIRTQLKYDIDTATQLSLQTRIGLESTRLDDRFGGITSDVTDTLSRISSVTDAESSRVRLNNSLSLSHRFSTPNRYLTFTADLFNSGRDDTRGLRSAGTSAADSVNQLSRQDALRSSFAPSLLYSEPLSSKASVRFKVAGEQKAALANRRTRVDLGGTGLLEDIDSTLSNSFEQRLSQYSGEAGFYWKDSLFKANADLEYRRADLSGVTTFPFDASTSRTFTNLLPSLSLSLVGVEGLYGSVSYNMDTRLPTVDQMQAVVDNSNPMLLSVGNPTIRQGLLHRISFDIQGSIPSLDAYFFTFGNVTYRSDLIGTSTVIAERDTVVESIPLLQGRQLTRPVNLEGGLSTFLFGYFSLQIDTLPLRVSATYNIDRDVTPGLINGILNEATSNRYSFGLSTSYFPGEEFWFDAGVDYSFGNVRNTLASGLDNSYSTMSYRASLTWTLWKGLDLTANLNNRINGGLSDGFNQNITLLNISLSQALFASDQGSLELTVRDALNQNNQVSRTFNNVFTEDSRASLLQRVVLLTFRYRFRHFGED
ncbi:MAG: hypothetical protein FGM33_01685 [Candidatus Kapabacteria bacterium]|nr:hypothetical protein [Candidatus Kapabacteria bacterium]